MLMIDYCHYADMLAVYFAAAATITPPHGAVTGRRQVMWARGRRRRR